MKNIVVIDLNVFVRALLGSKINKTIYEAIKEEKIILAFCPDMLENLARVLFKPRLKLKLEDIKELLELIKTKAVIVKPDTEINVCRDASDNIILETAMTTKADVIISNDKDLLVLKSFRGISIIKPKKFLNQLKR